MGFKEVESVVTESASVIPWSSGWGRGMGLSFQRSTREPSGGMETLWGQLQGYQFAKSSNCILRKAAFYCM